MFDSIISLVSSVYPSDLKKDDDVTDRLSHRYTVILLVVFALVASYTQYIGTPIVCWVPAHFTGSHLKFTNSYCWVKNTYFLPLEDEIPDSEEYESGEGGKEILYYQWIPFILISQAIFFYLPHQVWRTFNSKAGVDADNITSAAEKYQNSDSLDKKTKFLQLLINQFHRFLGGRKKKAIRKSAGCKDCISRYFCCCCGKSYGNYLLLLFLFVKLLFIVNTFGQLFILNMILRTDYNFYGANVIDGLRDGDFETSAWINNTVFPRVTMCNFKIRVLGNVQRYTVQCVLPINLYLEKMYAFLWFWLIMIGMLQCGNFMAWVLRTICVKDRLHFVRNHFKFGDRFQGRNHKAYSYEFAEEYLKQDGVFLLRLIGNNTNKLTANEITIALWDDWIKRTKGTPGRKPPLLPKPRMKSQ